MDWLALIVGVVLVYNGAWSVPRQLARIRQRVVDRDGDTTKWDATMPRTLRIVRPVMIVAGAVSIVLGVTG